MKNVCALMTCALLLGAPVYAQNDQANAGSGTGAGAGSGSSQTKSTTSSSTTSSSNSQEISSKFIQGLANVQIEVTLSDQFGTRQPEKKTVSMIVANRNWGKIRSAAQVMVPGEAPYVVELNVDARPLVSVDGPIQLEMTLVYAPVKSDDKDAPKQRPSGINQSQTVIMQSGKPMVIAQAADPATDRKVVVEVKATVLK